MLLRRLMALGLLLLPLAAVPATAAPACPGRTTTGSWTTVELPSFASGDASASRHAVSASRPDLVYVSNGRTVLRSTDGGCRWSDVLTLPAAPTVDRPFSPGAVIVAMAVPEVATGAQHLHLLVNDPPTGTTAPLGPLSAAPGATRLLSTEDAGKTWRLSGALPAQGNTLGERCSSLTYCALTIAPSDPSVLYLGLSVVGSFTPALLLRSADGGRSWQRSSVPTDYVGTRSGGALRAGTPGGVEVIEVDPLDPDTVWSKAGLTTTSRSVDGGQTWTYVSTGYDFRLPALDVFHRPGAPSRLVALQSGTSLSHEIDHHSRSDDGGAGWTDGPSANVGLSDIEADGIAHGSRSDDVVVSVTRPSGLRGWSPRARRYVDLDPGKRLARHAPVSDVQATRERTPRFVLLGKDVLLTYRGPVGADIPVRTTTVTTRR